tara:strand:- start:542 stop:1231 length:690 start_codon:yes stop_codon:yes gene_type:complete
MLKGKLIRLAVLLTIVISPFALAEKAEVYRWEPFPGQTNKIIENMMRAADIHREQGAHVSIYQMDVGSAGQPFDYVLRWDNEKDWAATRAQTRSPEWQKFWESVSKDPSGELVMSSEFYNLDPSVPADVFEGRDVFRVFVWQPMPGKSMELVQLFSEAKSIHEKLGARIDLYSEGVGGSGNFHYLMTFKNWGELAKFNAKIATSKEHQALLAKGGTTAKLVQSMQGMSL